MATKRGTRAKAEKVLSLRLERETATIDPLTTLVVVRESDASDLVLFENMAHKTISGLLPRMPELAPLLEDPLGPILTPAKYGAVIERSRQSKSIKFLFADVLFLYHLGSAAHIDDDQDLNFFTQQLLGMLEEPSIHELCAFAVNRVVRDEPNGNDLGKVFSLRSIKVIVEGQEFDFTKPYAGMLWSLAVILAAQERNGIVERNRLGKVAAARRTYWPHGPKAIPLGYRLEGKTLVPVEEERDRVRRVLDLLAAPDLSTRQFVEELGMMHVTRPGVKERYGEHATLAAVRHPKDIQQSFLNMMSLYETGVYEMPLPNPTKGAKVFGGLAVHRSDDSDPMDYGFVILRYDFGLPEGGWAPPETFEAIRAKQQANRAFVNGNRQRRAFGGRPPYEVGGVVYQFESSGMNRYRLCRLEGSDLLAPDESRSDARQDPRITGKESIATLDAEEFHRVLISTIVEALSTIGSEGELRASALKAVVDPTTSLRLTIEFHQRRADRAREEALRTDDAATAAAFRREAETEERAIADLRVHGADEPVASQVVDHVRVDVGQFVTLLAKVVKSDLKVPGAVATAIQRLIPELKVHPTSERGVLGWVVTVHLPTEGGGVLALGPIRGRVECNVVHRATRRDGSVDPIALAAFARGETLEAIAAELEVSRTTAWQRVRSGLSEGGLPEAAMSRLVRAPVRELRMLFGALALKHLGGDVEAVRGDPGMLTELLVSADVVPAGADPAWAAATVALYFSELSVRGSWEARDPIGQTAVDFVVSRGGSCTVEELLGRIGPLALNASAAISRVLGRLGKYPSAVLESALPLDKDHDGRLNREETIRLVTCPHCGEPLTMVVRATEVPSHMLCAQCRRSPSAEHPFPPGYFERDASDSPDGATEGDVVVPKKKTGGPPVALGAQQAQAIIEDYRSGRIIGGRDGILARHGITSGRLYTTLREHDVALRQPFRPRTR